MLGSNKFVKFAILSFVNFVNFIKSRAVNMKTHKTIIFFPNVEFYFILAPYIQPNVPINIYDFLKKMF